jgi:phosphatidylserine decarboxylase
MIRFGSRVDLFLPTNIRILVNVGDTTLVGHTVVAEWN